LVSNVSKFILSKLTLHWYFLHQEKVQLQASQIKIDHDQKRLVNLESQVQESIKNERQLQNKLLQVNEEKNILDSALRESRENSSKLREQLDRATIDSERALTDVTRLNKEKKRILSELNKLTHQVTQLASKIEEMDQDQREKQSHLEKTEKEAQQLRFQLTQVNEISQADRTQLEKELTQSRREQREAHTQAENLKRQLDAAQAKIATQASTIAHLQSQPKLNIPIGNESKHQWDQEILELERENEQLSQIIKEMRQEMEKVAYEHSTMLTATQEEKSKLSGQLEESQKQIHNVESEMNIKNKKIEELEEKLKHLEIHRGMHGYPVAPGYFVPPHGGPPGWGMPYGPPEPVYGVDPTVVHQLQEQVKQSSSRIISLMEERENLIEKSNALRAENRKLRQFHDTWLAPAPIPVPEVKTQEVQTVPILNLTTSSRLQKVPLKPALGTAKPIPTASKKKAPQGTQSMDSNDNKEVLLRLRKQGLRNWNDATDSHVS
jgi:DNA repair exonuclease SbcCD ATPase subunit